MKHFPFSILLIGMTLVSSANALILETMIDKVDLEANLSNKKVGYYIGSFDPLHLGHEEVATLPIIKGLCDYVLIYPNWGGDDYKDRADIKLRQEMLFRVFAHHPAVIVTRLSPQDLQAKLTKPSNRKSQEGKPLIEVTIPGLKFIGIIGSDTALSYHKRPENARALMTGIQIPEKYYNHTIGGLMALPVDSFIVSMRTGDDISCLNNKIIDRPIIAVIENEKSKGQSSTAVKKALKDGKAIDRMVSKEVAKIIDENRLYNDVK